MLTERELSKIFSWLPYRSDWPVDRDRREDNVQDHFGRLIMTFTSNVHFDTYYSQDDGVSNYLEFICYPTGYKLYDVNVVLVCVSLCAPITAYGQTTFHKTSDSHGYNFISVNSVGIVTDERLNAIEVEIKEILSNNGLTIIDKEFAAKQLPNDVAENLKNENLNFGNQYLHGLFQWTD